MATTDHPKVMRLSAASVEVTEPEIQRLIDELSSVSTGDADELRRRIHLVARKYSLDAAEDELPLNEAVAP